MSGPTQLPSLCPATSRHAFNPTSLTLVACAASPARSSASASSSAPARRSRTHNFLLKSRQLSNRSQPSSVRNSRNFPPQQTNSPPPQHPSRNPSQKKFATSSVAGSPARARLPNNLRSYQFSNAPHFPRMLGKPKHRLPKYAVRLRAASSQMHPHQIRLPLRHPPHPSSLNPSSNASSKPPAPSSKAASPKHCSTHTSEHLRTISKAA